MKHLLLILFIFVSGLISAQQKPYRNDVVIVRFKEEFRETCKENGLTDQNLLLEFQKAGITSIHKIFPAHQKPQRSFDAFGNEFSDLSLIYGCRLNPGIEPENAIHRLKKITALKYVELYPLPSAVYVPNDPLLNQQYAPALIKCYQAWDINKGDTSIIIGIIDTGVDPDHPDLAANVHFNYSDPIDGIDNDGDGYTDNFMGWDLGENDNNPSSNANHHGVHVSGIAAAVTDNSTGIAGVGFRSKFLPVKISNGAGILTRAYEGIVYAADMGCRVINCSWGGTVGGEFGKDVVNYATFNRNALVVAAAGNNNFQNNFFPAAYDNVMAVAGTDQNDVKYNLSNFGYYMDISAPGQDIHSTWDGGNYSTSSGTSMAAPQVAGAAAIVASQFPSFTALQLREQLRVTGDNIQAQNPAYHDKLGKGRLNLYRALTENNRVSVRPVRIRHRDNGAGNYRSGDTLETLVTLRNYLSSSPAINATVTSLSPYLTAIDGQANYPGLATMDTAVNAGDPFKFKISAQVPRNAAAMLRLTLNGSGYNENYYFEINLNTDYYNVTINNVHTTLTGFGRIGYYDPQNIGLGFIYKNENLLYEGGVMIGSSITGVSDAVRGVNAPEEDFYSYIPIYRSNTGASDLDLMNWFNDYGPTSDNPLGLDVWHRAYAWTDPGSENFVVVRYFIVNNGTAHTFLPDVYAGIFADWDIFNYNQNIGATDTALRLGYVFNTDSVRMFAGVKMLSAGGFTHHAVDNSSGGGSVNTNDGLNSSEKYTLLSTNNFQAGGTFGTDVIQVLGAGPFNLNTGDTAEVAFAILAADSLPQLLAAAQAAQVKYDTEVPLIINKITEDFNIKVFPNPASQYLNIESAENLNSFTFHLFDITGRETIKVNLSESQNTLNVSNLAPGVYFYTISGRDGSIKSGRVVLSGFPNR